MIIFKSLRYWILGGYAIPIILMISSASVVSINVNRVQKDATELSQSRKMGELVLEIGLNAQTLSKTVRGYLLLKNDTSLNTYNNGKSKYEQTLPLLKELIEDEQQENTLSVIESQVNNLIEFHDVLIKLVDEGKVGEARQEWEEGQGIKLAEELTASIERFRIREQEITNIRSESQTQSLNNLLASVWVSIGIAIAISIALGSWIITTIVQKITQEANNIALAATEISTTIEQQERVAVQQAASVNQTSTSMDELGASSRQSAEQASAASTGARQVLNLAGSSRSKDNYDGSPSLREKMAQVQGQILRLSENLSQIYNITNLVSDLANQTNMLALNASVEAVRAGEHGKGFGVVASEIRKLADQSRKSAEKIGSLIADIQNSTNSTVIVTEEGAKAVDKIIVSINDVAVNIQQISLNAKQQAMAIEQVIDAMNSLNTTANETANGLTQSKIGTQQLNETAQGLKNLV